MIVAFIKDITVQGDYVTLQVGQISSMTDHTTGCTVKMANGDRFDLAIRQEQLLRKIRRGTDVTVLLHAPETEDGE